MLFLSACATGLETRYDEPTDVCRYALQPLIQTERAFNLVNWLQTSRASLCLLLAEAVRKRPDSVELAALRAQLGC